MIDILHGDCLDEMDFLRDLGIQVDSVVTDPPYHLTSIVKRFGKPGSAPAQFGTDGAFARASRGFMGKEWDGGDIAFRPEMWRLCFDLLKPGGHLLAFSGTRTYHRMACAIEDAGFEIRDCIQWLYGSGFPKSRNIGDGWGTALKPACEPICVARKPLIGTVAANMQEHGTGALNIDGCRVDGGSRPLVTSDRRLEHNAYSPGLGGSKCEGATTLGRWPANVIHDGSPEVLEAFRGKESKSTGGKGTASGLIDNDSIYGKFSGENKGATAGGFGDSGSVARFFYCAKASKKDRAGSKHPTVKPIALMRYLCRLITPPGGTVLDPFAGSGTTLQAAQEEGFNAIGIEREDEYVADIRRRMEIFS